MLLKKDNIDKLADDYLNDIKGIWGVHLVSLVLFGSGARNDFNPKTSDLNFLIVLQPEGMQQLQRSFALTKKWLKKRVTIPLLMTESYILSSLDTFPIEFLNFKLHHKLLFGKDILSNLEISDSYLRLKCEEQVKSKLLHLRERFLHTLGKKYLMHELIYQTVPTLASIFSGLVVLKGARVPNSNEDIFLETARLYGLSESVFRRVIDVRKGMKMTRNDLLFVLESYISEMEQLSDIVDRLKS